MISDRVLAVLFLGKSVVGGIALSNKSHYFIMDLKHLIVGQNFDVIVYVYMLMFDFYHT